MEEGEGGGGWHTAIGGEERGGLDCTDQESLAPLASEPPLDLLSCTQGEEEGGRVIEVRPKGQRGQMDRTQVKPGQREAIWIGDRSNRGRGG